jgi:hypothetical protein
VAEDRLPMVCATPGCTGCGADHKLENWVMYDVPLTLSVLAPHESAARAYTDQWLASGRVSLYSDGPAYNRDHIFRDGEPRRCDCVGH